MAHDRLTVSVLQNGAAHSPRDAAQPAVRQQAVGPACPSFDEVYTRHAAFVFRILRGMGVPDAQVDDALQDVFLVVHRRLAEFTGEARITTWLFEISLRVASHYRRKQKRARDHTPLSEALLSCQQSPQEEAETSEQVAHLTQALSMLDDEKRAMLVLAEIEGMTAPEIAKITGSPINTVYTKLRRARAAFAQFWNQRREP